MDIQELRERVYESEPVKDAFQSVTFARRQLINAASGTGEISEGDSQRIILAVRKLRNAEEQRNRLIAEAFATLTDPDRQDPTAPPPNNR